MFPKLVSTSFKVKFREGSPPVRTASPSPGWPIQIEFSEGPAFYSEARNKAAVGNYLEPCCVFSRLPPPGLIPAEVSRDVPAVEVTLAKVDAKSLLSTAPGRPSWACPRVLTCRRDPGTQGSPPDTPSLLPILLGVLSRDNLNLSQ